MPGYRNIGRSPARTTVHRTFTAAPVNPPTWEDADLTADDLRAHREASTSVDAPPPVPITAHVAYNPTPALTFLPEFQAKFPGDLTPVFRASIARARRRARLRRTIQFVFPIIVLIGAYPIAAYIASLAGNPVP